MEGGGKEGEGGGGREGVHEMETGERNRGKEDHALLPYLQILT